MEGPKADETQAEDPAPPFPLEGPARIMVQHRSIGSPSTLNVVYCYPSGAPSTAFLKQRIIALQEKWAFLKHTIIDQRTPQPKIRTRPSPWATGDVLFEETYTPIADLQAQVSELFEDALRKFQHSNDYTDSPLWALRVFRSPIPEGREYLCTLADHITTDGRGALRLAKAFVAADISDLPTERPEFYASTPHLAAGLPGWWIITREVFRAALLPALPSFASRWWGYTPAWPLALEKKRIDCPWRISFLFIPRDVVDRFKASAKSHGITTLNPALYATFCAAHWATFHSSLAIQASTLKDVRGTDPAHPYCYGNYFSVLTTQTPLGPDQDLWQIASDYAQACDAPGAVERGIDLLRLTSLLPDGPLDPSRSPPAPPKDRMPKGDKRAHTKGEALALTSINTQTPTNYGSGIWSNLTFEPLPEGADDMVFGGSGMDTGLPFNVCTIGHEGGIRIEIAFSDGAAMTREEVERLQRNMRAIMERVAEGRGPWDFRSLNP